MKTYLATREFWTGAGERAVRAFAAALVATLLGPKVMPEFGVDVLHVGWRDSLSLAVGAALVSVLVSVVAGKAAGPAGSPSLVDDRPPGATVVDGSRVTVYDGAGREAWHGQIESVSYPEGVTPEQVLKEIDDRDKLARS